MSTRQAVTPWFLGSQHAPVRDGTYQVRFCIGWREVFCTFRGGKWWLPGVPFQKPHALNLRRWPGFHWRGLEAPAGRSEG